ncbi:helix-turn-helix domain-containing protein [Streptomyces sp. NPDC006704]|uniref:helix-turn-helix domain-containing protein n=1 Tax=Streptomyces sp. NPDC006704 TaxID=3364760 RepID=UPI0036BD3A4A
MSAEHMGMVFAAEGLDGSEKLLLLGYTNWTDPYGYCWPSEERLADDCGTSRSTVQRAKRKLVKRKLLKSVRRTNSKGEPISNLSRVNLPLLASMARKRTTYDDNLIDQITFDDDTQGDPETTLRGTPDNPEHPSDLLTRHSDSYPESNRLVPRVRLTRTPGQNDSQSRSDPVVIPKGNSLSPVSRPAKAPRAQVAKRSEREKAAPPEQPPAAPAAGVEAVVTAYSTAAGRPVVNGTKARLRRQAAELLAEGLPVEWLADRAAEMPARGWIDLERHVGHSTVPIPGQQQAHRPSNSLPPWCGVCGGGTDHDGTPLHDAVLRNGAFRRINGEPCPDCHPATAPSGSSGADSAPS